MPFQILSLIIEIDCVIVYQSYRLLFFASHDTSQESYNHLFLAVQITMTFVSPIHSFLRTRKNMGVLLSVKEIPHRP